MPYHDILFLEPVPLESEKQREKNWSSLSFCSKTNSKLFIDFSISQTFLLLNILVYIFTHYNMLSLSCKLIILSKIKIF